MRVSNILTNLVHTVMIAVMKNPTEDPDMFYEPGDCFGIISHMSLAVSADQSALYGCRIVCLVVYLLVHVKESFHR